ncbi:MAG TPA: Flp family type IVb pilin [Firmicutes bacterium]|uniref:Flp family type IVb pilin n=1 Tax=Candidatus Fermentithermobacillus carboniphilus TaxID=3085328 RepID=A0AAT9LEV7_9FIRM|nr:MAG: Flp family type IVb pilin [Candidatus Fermentithermobacillus carboniphilus]HHW17282.1 Flp family type IVb pilin [Candidatus Fermentithermobacillaceae bacterium]
MLKLLKRLATEEEGQGLVEYALILALIAVVVIVAVTDVGTRAKEIFNSIKDKLVTPTS